MRKSFPGILANAVCLTVAGGCAARDNPPYEWRTQTPLTYIRDYSAGHPYLAKLSWKFWTDSKVDFLWELKAIGSAGWGQV